MTQTIPMTREQIISYEEAWNFLDRLQFFKIKLGLDSMTLFMESLGNPHLRFPCIHVGGTNGKGSVCASLLSVLTAAGYRVGLYTSPHLSSVRERFRIDGRYISREEFARQAARIITILDNRQITYFEFTTALAMLWFAEQEVDLALLEVGLGGRLDATNIVTPQVALITNVTMDHEQYLGDTIESVAGEKAGIIKPGVPVITGAAGSALAVISSAAKEKASPLYVLGRDFSGERSTNTKKPARWTYRGIHWTMSDLPLAMKGDYQVDNGALALAALEQIGPAFPVTEDAVRQGLAQARWPGRLEELRIPARGRKEENGPGKNSCRVLLDGAHNPDGAKSLRRSLERDFRAERLLLVWASMADKDVRATLMEIAPLAEQIIFTRPDAERSALPRDLQALLPPGLAARSTCIESVEEAVDHALARCDPDTLICVAGSLYLVGRARKHLVGELVEP
ncbi:MAG: folylpolyglutamate synthase/dihydrofolate synthase family protein [Desulfobulbaceae bacterium]